MDIIQMKKNMHAKESISKVMITYVCRQQLHLDFRVSYICQAREWPNQNNAPKMQLYHAKEREKRKEKENENKERKKMTSKKEEKMLKKMQSKHQSTSVCYTYYSTSQHNCEYSIMEMGARCS